MNSTSIGRRAFLRFAAAAGLPAVVPLHHAFARLTPAAAGLRVGIVLPHADAARAGALFGAAEAEHAARLFRSEFAALDRPADRAEGAALAAERLLEDGAAQAIVGGGTPPAADAIMRVTERYGALFVNVGCAVESLHEPCGPLAFHVLPSEAMRIDALAAVPDAPAGARALAWHPSLHRFGAAQVNDRFRAARGYGMTERAWSGWIALKILFDAAQRAGGAEPARLARHLVSGQAVFDGHKGVQLSFRPSSHQLRQPLYVVAGSDVVTQVPDARAAGGMTHAQLLDTIGMSGGEPCGS